MVGACFERGDRWLDEEPPPPVCNVGDKRCTTAVEECRATGNITAWVVVDDCAARDKICVEGIFECKTCRPSAQFCDGLDVRVCDAEGESSSYVTTCDASEGRACRGGECKQLCNDALAFKSNVGCEYWAVDLDNANVDATSNAAAQQFAVVVSNPQPDVPVVVRIEQDDSLPGTANDPHVIAEATIAPLNLQVFKLGPREVDGSPEGEFDTGTHTALTRHGYRVSTDFPVVAYQFNPLENVSVFSNDASLLYPREALTSDASSLVRSYVVLGWPQTIAATDDPDTNFNPLDPTHLRSFLTIVGTREETLVRVIPSTTVVPGGPVAMTEPGGMIDVTLGAFDVLNLETGDFAADFSGTEIFADGPVAVFSGSEAADAPHFDKLSQRRCCADHLEEQVAPIRTAGTTFAIPHSPNRGDAVKAAGADVKPIIEPEYVRFIATHDQGAVIETTLPAPDDHIELATAGAMAEVRVFSDFLATSSDPVLVAQVNASQQAGSVTKSGYPGGDPSLLFIPPIEQWRPDYVFLTPDKYAFDFVVVIAPFGATVLLDDQPLGPETCEVTPADGLDAATRGTENPTHVVYRCQLSFPTIDSSIDPPIIAVGTQNDGVHRIVSNTPVSIIVYGWDAFVSYAYAGGTELREIAPPE
ncbi:MAG: hypothetical protein HOW73_39785 [Polyangiaceae bacterium]|nr:hypothetical protein [Polyangiaceae bacterium]